MEVFNNSPTDPAAWLARIKTKKGKSYVVCQALGPVLFLRLCAAAGYGAKLCAVSAQLRAGSAVLQDCASCRVARVSQQSLYVTADVL